MTEFMQISSKNCLKSADFEHYDTIVQPFLSVGSLSET